MTADMISPINLVELLMVALSPDSSAEVAKPS
jgi:hypothetical protein